MKTLVVIPARGGSKGVPGKNIKLLGGRPLISYSIDFARAFTADDNICVSTDSEEIVNAVQALGLQVPFKRPIELSTDTSGTYEVLLHALSHYEKHGVFYDTILLLQPTSPFRESRHLKEIISCWTESLDMVVSVGESHHNPYFTLFEENDKSLLVKSKIGNYTRRQDAPACYYYNGSMYLINVSSLKARPIHQFQKVKKYLMDEIYCQDIDTQLDWLICETIIREKYVI